MKTNLFLLPLIASLALSCSNSRDEKLKTITEHEQKLYGDTLNPVNPSLAGELVKAYSEFTNEFPQDEKTPEYLFRAGELSMSLMKSSEAINYFKKIYDNYSSYPKAPDCLFLQAFIYENHLKRLADAQRLYNEFLKKYPDHNLADDAQFSLKFLGKSEEEIIKEFEKNQAAAADSGKSM